MGDGIVNKFALIVCGDPGEWFLSSVDDSIRTLESFGYDTYVASPSEPTITPDRYVDANLENIRGLTEEIKTRIDDDDELVFYSVTHGGPLGCMCFPDGCHLERLTSIVDNIPYGQREIIISECFSGNTQRLFLDNPRTLFMSSTGADEWSGSYFKSTFWSYTPESETTEINWRERYEYATSTATADIPLFISTYDYVFGGTPPFSNEVRQINNFSEMSDAIAELEPGQYAILMFVDRNGHPNSISDYNEQFQNAASRMNGRYMFLQTDSEELRQVYNVNFQYAWPVQYRAIDHRGLTYDFSYHSPNWDAFLNGHDCSEETGRQYSCSWHLSQDEQRNFYLHVMEYGPDIHARNRAHMNYANLAIVRRNASEIRDSLSRYRNFIGELASSDENLWECVTGNYLRLISELKSYESARIVREEMESLLSIESASGEEAHDSILQNRVFRILLSFILDVRFKADTAFDLISNNKDIITDLIQHWLDNEFGNNRSEIFAYLRSNFDNNDSNLRLQAIRFYGSLAQYIDPNEAAIASRQLSDCFVDLNDDVYYAAIDTYEAVAERLNEPQIFEELRNIRELLFYPTRRSIYAALRGYTILTKRLDESVVNQMRFMDQISAITINQMSEDKVHDIITGLIEALGDQNYFVRANAAQALGCMGPMAAPAVPVLIELLGDDDWQRHIDPSFLLVRQQAAIALGRIGPVTEEVIPALIEALGDHWLEVRAEVARVLGRIGPAAAPAVPALIEACRDADYNVRSDAAKALFNIGPTAVPMLIEVLGNENCFTRKEAAEALGDIGPAAAAAVPALIEALGDGFWEVRVEVVRTLGDIGPAAAPAAPALVELLEDEDHVLRRHAAEALGDIGPAAEIAVPALIDALEDDNSRVRSTAAFALASMGPAATPAVPALVELLEDEDPLMREDAARALGCMGSVSEPAVPALIDALGDDYQDVRHSAALALDKIGPAAAGFIPALIEGLGNENWLVRDLAVRALGRMGPAAESAVPALIEILGDVHYEIRGDTAETLGNIGPAAREAIPELDRLAVEDQNHRVRNKAIRALDEIILANAQAE